MVIGASLGGTILGYHKLSFGMKNPRDHCALKPFILSSHAKKNFLSSNTKFPCNINI
jgi:hypothetical protein